MHGASHSRDSRLWKSSVPDDRIHRASCTGPAAMRGGNLFLPPCLVAIFLCQSTDWTRRWDCTLCPYGRWFGGRKGATLDPWASEISKGLFLQLQLLTAMVCSHGEVGASAAECCCLPWTVQRTVWEHQAAWGQLWLLGKRIRELKPCRNRLLRLLSVLQISSPWDSPMCITHFCNFNAPFQFSPGSLITCSIATAYQLTSRLYLLLQHLEVLTSVLSSILCRPTLSAWQCSLI